LLRSPPSRVILDRSPILIRAGAHLPGAHHPHCDRFQHHLIWIGKRPLCLGCTSMIAGAGLGVIALFFVPWSKVTVVGWIVVHGLPLVATIVQPWIQLKAFKILSRSLLGATVASYWITGTLLLRVEAPRIVWIVAMSAAFATIYVALKTVRNRFPNDPCNDCPLGTFPTCDWNLPRLLADTAIDSEIRNVLASSRRLS